MSNKQQLIVFDFDGTLCDSRALSIGIVLDIAKQEKMEKLLAIDSADWNDLDVRSLIKKARLSPIAMLVLAEKVRSRLVKKKKQLRLFQGIATGIHSIQHPQNYLGVLSSNHSDVLKHCLAELPFDFVQSNRNLFGKAASLRKLTKKYQAEDVFYVGDEHRDMVAAKKAGFRPIGVEWGGDTKKTLLEAGAERVFDHADHLFDFFKV